ncbi:MAG: hypothetical protein V4555_20160 [Acidobacteriota bacterium]
MSIVGAVPIGDTDIFVTSISGQLNGGRQPIIGAHIFVFAAGTTADAGPGIAASASNKSTSLLTNSSAAGFPTTQDLTGSALTNPTYGDYYVTTNAFGQFSLGGEYTCTQGTQVYLYALGGDTGAGTNNSAAGLLGVLGQCPASGTMATLTPTVVMNEVSTIAAAYALSGYATDATHVSSKGSTLALTGIANSFANAAMLYDISGATNNGTANIFLPGNTGNSVVAYKGINSLANSLAACVNSSGSTSTQCTTSLFNAVKSTGSTGNVATDTATEAIYIAHNPGTSVGTIYNNASGIGTPFLPALSSAPNDWTIGVSIYNSGLTSPTSIFIDSKGNAFASGQKVAGFTPQGAPLAASNFGPNTNANGVRAAVDNAGYIWVSEYSGSTLSQYWGANAVSPTTPGTLVATYTSGGLNGPLWVSVDSAGNIWVANYGSNNSLSVFYGSNAPSPHNPGDPVTPSGYTGGGVSGARAVLQDFTGNAWAGSLNGLSQFCTTNSGCTFGSPLTGSAVASSTISAFSPLASDAAGNVWGPSASSLTAIVSLYGFSAVTPHTPGATVGSYTGGGLNDPLGFAVDGSGNVWVINFNKSQAQNGDQSCVAEFANSGAAISPSTGYMSSNPELNSTSFSGPSITGGSGIAVDGSGNVWIGNSLDGNLEILIGAATPVATPISANLSAPYGTANVNRP